MRRSKIPTRNPGDRHLVRRTSAENFGHEFVTQLASGKAEARQSGGYRKGACDHLIHFDQ